MILAKTFLVLFLVGFIIGIVCGLAKLPVWALIIMIGLVVFCVVSLIFEELDKRKMINLLIGFSNIFLVSFLLGVLFAVLGLSFYAVLYGAIFLSIVCPIRAFGWFH